MWPSPPPHPCSLIAGNNNLSIEEIDRLIDGVAFGRWLAVIVSPTYRSHVALVSAACLVSWSGVPLPILLILLMEQLGNFLYIASFPFGASCYDGLV